MSGVAVDCVAPVEGAAGGVRFRAPSPLLCLAVPALLIGLVGRLYVDWSAPLWLDESFTAAIADSPTLHRLFDWCIQDPNAPLYYVFVWLWSHISGVSALSLRIPSAVFSVAAPLLVVWKGHEDREIRLFWGSLLALWAPIWIFASDARCYSLLFLLGVWQAVLFMRAVERGDAKGMASWATVSALMCLTHYYAVFLTFAQFVLLVGYAPRRAVRSYAAFLPLVVAGVWFCIHILSLYRFTNQDTSWYKLMTLDQAMGVVDIIFEFWPRLVASILAVTVAHRLTKWALRKSPWGYSASETMVSASAFVAVLLVIGIACIRPIFSERYLIPMVPAALLALALWARRVAGSSRIPMLALIFLWCSGAVTTVAANNPGATRARSGYNLEHPAEWLRGQGLRRLVFYWGHPAAVLYSRDLLADVGSEYLRRTGWHGPVVGLAERGAGFDPTPMLAARASRSGDGFLWADRTAINGDDPHSVPALLRDQRIWNCRTFGQNSVPVLACIRR